MLAWDTITPFGLPVEPDVYRMNIGYRKNELEIGMLKCMDAPTWYAEMVKPADFE